MQQRPVVVRADPTALALEWMDCICGVSPEETAVARDAHRVGHLVLRVLVGREVEVEELEHERCAAGGRMRCECYEAPAKRGTVGLV